MRSTFIIAIELLAIVVAGYLFHSRCADNRSDVDVVGEACKGMPTHYQPSSKVNFVTNVDRVELLYWVRYVNYPMYIDKGIKSDTTLFFLGAHSNNDSLLSIVKSKTRIWANVTGDYTLYLVKD